LQFKIGDNSIFFPSFGGFGVDGKFGYKAIKKLSFYILSLTAKIFYFLPFIFATQQKKAGQ
jgi:hypothetical protein